MRKRYWVGSVGPLYYHDDHLYGDGSLQRAFKTDGALETALMKIGTLTGVLKGTGGWVGLGTGEDIAKLPVWWHSDSTYAFVAPDTDGTIYWKMVFVLNNVRVLCVDRNGLHMKGSFIELPYPVDLGVFGQDSKNGEIEYNSTDNSIMFSLLVGANFYRVGEVDSVGNVRAALLQEDGAFPKRTIEVPVLDMYYGANTSEDSLNFSADKVRLFMRLKRLGGGVPINATLECKQIWEGETI